MFSVNVVDILSSILLCAVVLLVLVGNTLVVLAVATSRKLRTVTNVFIVNLACADLLLGVLILPFSAVLEIKDNWIFGHVWCQVWLAVDVWLCTASILNLCCISLDRYLAITRPIRYPGLMSSRRAKTLVAGVWLFSFIIGCPPLIGWNDTFEEGMDLNGTTIAPPVTTTTVATTESAYPACQGDMISHNGIYLNESCIMTSDRTFIITCELTNSRGYRIYAAFGSFFVPMLVMVFFYLQIYRAAMKTISAYAKGELKTKCSGKERANGQTTNSVTLRIHRGGRGYSGRESGCGNIQRSSPTNRTFREGNAEKDKDCRHLGRGEGFVGQTSIRKARSSDASLVTLTDLACEVLDRDAINRSSLSDVIHKRCKSFCWNTDKRCTECSNLTCKDDIQNGHTSRAKLSGTRCLSTDSEESSSSEIKNRIKRPSEITRASPQSSLHFTPSASCQTEAGVVFVRGTSTSEYTHRRPRFSTQRPVNAMKLHMQKFNREKKAAKTLAIIVGAFIVCWMPFFTTYLVGAFCDSCVSPLLFSVVFWLGYCNSAMNPCVYALFSRDFRFAFRKLLMCRCQLLRRTRNFRPQSSDVPAIQLHCAPPDEARSSSDLEGQWR
ncbi:hypothetical protein BsWGS_05282 [Bradybaena similaris]